VSTWDDYVFPIQRADAIQYFILYYYSGIYIDMDTICNNTFPIHQIQPRTTKDYALFKSTLPTGITNDFIISTAQHPAFKEAILRLPGFHDRTRLWARLQSYVAIMMSTGPLFITLVVKEYLLSQPFLPSLSIQFVNFSQLTPYITDLESASWHGDDAQVLM
jgi:mannosyltransferase OCH1-like enzyme